MERIKTGIKGFDDLIEGGLPRGSSILLAGTPGTGKTIFALEFLYNGAKRFNENGLYVSFEENLPNLIDQARQFSWDFEDLEKRGKIRFLTMPASKIQRDVLKDVVKLAKDEHIKRIVIDSLSTLSINTPVVSSKAEFMGDYAVKRFVYSFIEGMKELKYSTSLLISQTQSEKELSSDKISEFACDGVIHLSFESMGGEFSRSLLVRKMRRTKNDEDIHPVEISSNGLAIHKVG